MVEFGGAAEQGVIHRYVNGEDVSFTELRHVWADTAGWVPGPTSLGYVNFYANVRAANLKLAPDHRIKVWLGDPKIDWSKIRSFQDLRPYLAIRNDSFFRVINDEILKKHKKTLLIIGSAHLFGHDSPRLLSTKIDAAYPGALAVALPFTGYVDPTCNSKFLDRVKSWPVPALAWPVRGTWLKSELQNPGCEVVSPEHAGGTKEIAAAQSMTLAGVNADAILYLGPPDGLTWSPVEDSIYLDPHYFNEQNRRRQCCAPKGVKPLDWDQLVQLNSVLPKRIQEPRNFNIALRRVSDRAVAPCRQPGS